MAMATIGFTHQNQDKDMFKYILLITRFIQGFAQSIILSVCFSISAGPYYKEDQLQIEDLFKKQLGLSFFISPLVGSLIRMFMGYNAPFIFFASIYLLLAVLVKAFLPLKLNDRDPDAHFDLGTLSPNMVELNFAKLMNNRHILLTCISGSMSFYVLTQQEPILGLRLVEYGIEEKYVGFIYAIAPICFVLTG